MSKKDLQALKQQYNQETAKISWKELERYFAAGKLILVDAKLDLVEVAVQMHLDNKDLVKSWMDNQQLQGVDVAQAKIWHEQQVDLWAVVVAPWVLVQDKR